MNIDPMMAPRPYGPLPVTRFPMTSNSNGVDVEVNDEEQEDL